MRLMGFLTGVYFPQILITVCKPEKRFTYVMLLQFGTALSSERGSRKVAAEKKELVLSEIWIQVST